MATLANPEREALRQRALAAGKKSPTTASINATLAKNKTRAALTRPASLDAKTQPIEKGQSTADIYRSITGQEPGAAEKSLSPQQYREQVLNQFAGSPQLGKIDVSKGYAGELAQATLAHLLKIGPQGYVGVNSGKRDDREYASVLEGARRYAAMPTGVTSRNPNIPLDKSMAGEAQDAKAQGDANAYWTRLSNALAAAVRKPVARPKAKAKAKAKK